MTIFLLILAFAIVTVHVVMQSRYIKELKTQNIKTNNLLQVTKDILWERIVPHQQFPYQDMEAMLDRYATETNGGVKVMLRQKLTGKA